MSRRVLHSTRAAAAEPRQQCGVPPARFSPRLPLPVHHPTAPPARSRNALLSPEDRQRCVCISAALAAAREAATSGAVADAGALQLQVTEAIAAGGRCCVQGTAWLRREDTGKLDGRALQVLPCPPTAPSLAAPSALVSSSRRRRPRRLRGGGVRLHAAPAARRPRLWADRAHRRGGSLRARALDRQRRFRGVGGAHAQRAARVRAVQLPACLARRTAPRALCVACRFFLVLPPTHRTAFLLPPFHPTSATAAPTYRYSEHLQLQLAWQGQHVGQH